MLHEKLIVVGTEGATKATTRREPVSSGPGQSNTISPCASVAAMYDEDLKRCVKWCDGLKMNPDDGARQCAVKLTA
ncbi:MAG: hypothetical protein ABI399_08650 [Bauldia sp.]